ncbi:hypothetical protein [Cellulomonas terrae]|uniref:Uncharacterized protein n=1 Tax=Cellulomonas terrae TaxID=311234 RepID=A0A511JJD4_9CELL|nr:hypothetical protein [Cellulomonas terrae]GEL98132.1 hypothetical protein CTE05_16790 [Cellulomonas terrae]
MDSIADEPMTSDDALDVIWAAIRFNRVMAEFPAGLLDAAFELLQVARSDSGEDAWT